MTTRTSRRDWIAYGIVLLAEAAYIVLTLKAPPASSPNSLGLTPLEMILVQFTIVVPYLIAWLAGTRGALGFQRCLETIPEEEGGRGFGDCALGVALLVIGSLVTALLGAFRPFVAVGSAAAVGLTIANNYVYVLTNLLASLLLFRGASRLVRRSENRSYERDDLIMAVILAVVIAGLYAPLVFTNPARQASLTPGVAASYYLPDVVIALTIVVPFIAAWTLGFLTAMRIARYMPSSRDAEQKKAVRKFVNGLWVTLFSSILLQLLVSTGTDRLLSLGLGPILAVIYAFIILQIVGFALISIGSKSLCRLIEPPRKLEVKAVPL